MKLLLEGFPTLGLNQKLDLPSIAEILRSPMFIRADINDVYKYGGEFNRWLVDNAPLSNQKKNVCVTVDLKALSPNSMPMRTDSWHCDGSDGCYFSEDELFHIMIGHTDLVTAFLNEPYEWQTTDKVVGMNHYDFRVHMQKEIGEDLELKSKLIPKDTFVTFNSHHAHKAPNAPSKHEFRLSVIIRESNFNQSIPWNEAKTATVHAWDNTADRNAINVEWIERGIVLRDIRP